MLRIALLVSLGIMISRYAIAPAWGGEPSLNRQLRTVAYSLSYRHAEGIIVISNNNANSNQSAMALTPGGNDPRLRFLDPANVTEVAALPNQAIVIQGKLDWCSYVVTVSTTKDAPNRINSRVEVQTTRALVPSPDQKQSIFGGHYPELSMIDSGLRIQPRSAIDATYYFNGTPGAKTYHTRVPASGTVYDLNQFVFFGDSTALDSTLHYFVDFSSLRDYYRTTGTRILDAVTQPPGCLELKEGSSVKPMVFGYDVPGIKQALPLGASLLLANSTIYLEPGVPAITEPVDYCRRFVTGYENIYPLIEKPESKFVDWPDLTEKGFADVLKCEEKLGHSQIGPQTNLWSIKRYLEKFPSETGQTLIGDDEQRWSHMYQSLPYGDAWQYLFAYCVAGEYAQDFDSPTARKVFLDGAADVVKAGQKLNYIFPLAIDAEFTNQGKWLNEYDCTGAYVFLTLLYYQETRDQLYLDEARKAADVLLTLGFEFPYEFTTTSLGPIGLLRLYKLTKDPRYLDACAIPLAAILRHSWAFNPGYREYQGRNIFLLTEGMPGVYSNGWEEATLLRYLYLFLVEGQGIVRQPILDLVSELLRWKGMNVADSLIPLYPDKSIVYTGRPREFPFPVVNEWYIPVEGFGYLEWDDSGLHDKPGRVSQGPYCFGALPEAALLLFHPIVGEATLYVEAPIAFTKRSEASDSFKVLGGLQEYKVAIKARSDNSVDINTVVITSKSGDAIDFGEVDPQGWAWAVAKPNTEYTAGIQR